MKQTKGLKMELLFFIPDRVSAWLTMLHRCSSLVSRFLFVTLEVEPMKILSSPLKQTKMINKEIIKQKRNDPLKDVIWLPIPILFLGQKYYSFWSEKTSQIWIQCIVLKQNLHCYTLFKFPWKMAWLYKMVSVAGGDIQGWAKIQTVNFTGLWSREQLSSILLTKIHLTYDVFSK